MNYRINFIIRFSLRDLSFLNLCFRRHGWTSRVGILCRSSRRTTTKSLWLPLWLYETLENEPTQAAEIMKANVEHSIRKNRQREKCAELWKVRFHSYPFVEFCFCLFFRLFQRYTSMLGVFVFVFASLFRCVFYFMYIFSIYFRYFVLTLFL